MVKLVVKSELREIFSTGNMQGESLVVIQQPYGGKHKSNCAVFSCTVPVRCFQVGEATRMPEPVVL